MQLNFSAGQPCAAGKQYSGNTGNAYLLHLNSKRNPYARHQSDALETQLIRVVHLLFGSCTLRFHLTLLDISRSKATDIGKHIQMRQHTVRNTAIYIYSPGVCSHLIFRFVLPTFIGIPQITASVTDRQDAAVGYITTKFHLGTHVVNLNIFGYQCRTYRIIARSREVGVQGSYTKPFGNL